MPGELITADWQIELRGTLMGAATGFRITPPGIEGLGVPQVKDNDVELDGADGSYATRDYNAGRLVTVAFLVTAATQSAALARLRDLNTVWAPATSADLQLHMRLPGWRFKVLGRPRGVEQDISAARFGVVKALASFFCPDPTILLITVPGAPGTPVATAGVGSATVTWTAPASDGNQPITNYRVTPYIGAVAQAATTVGNVLTTTITGLTAGTSYTFKVAAINAEGTGPDSAASNAVTPT